MNTLSYNEIFLDGIQLTTPELERKLDELKDDEVIELNEVDRHGNLHFETRTVGLYY